MRCVSKARFDVLVNRSIEVNPSTICNNACHQCHDGLGLPGVELRHALFKWVPKALSNKAAMAEHFNGGRAIGRSIV